MNILRKYVLNNIKLNKKTTSVSIISIALSTMLICSIIIIANSFYTTLKNDVKAVNGSQHETFRDIDKLQAKKIISNNIIEDYFVTQTKGYAKLLNTIGREYICIMEFDNKAFENFGIKLLDGRFPQNSNEIILSNQINQNTTEKYEIGQTITLETNKLFLDGKNEITQRTLYLNSYIDEGRITKKYIDTKEYKIVGIIEKPGYQIELSKVARIYCNN